MIDHVKLFVSDYQRSRTFYLAALMPLGYSIIREPEGLGAGFGRDRSELWLAPCTDGHATRTHVALGVESAGEVDAFHVAALAAGASDNGGPGLRPEYHPCYYGAFVLDPDGNNLEAVCHRGS